MAAPPAAFGFAQMKQFAVLPIVFMCQKIDFEKPENKDRQTYVQIFYVVSQLMNLALLFYIQMKIGGNKDDTKVVVPKVEQFGYVAARVPVRARVFERRRAQLDRGEMRRSNQLFLFTH